ncbi:MAG: hypothetical protein ABR544_04850 [Gammaproteobacteria bacterium]
MKQFLLSLFVPPFAAYRYGCAGCCAAPIGVFWIAGITGIIYGLVGGPTNRFGVDWEFVGLGVATWLVATIWTRVTIAGADADKCARKSSTLCSKIMPGADESDPFDEVRKAR